MSAIQKRILRSSNPRFPAGPQFLSATRTIRNQAYLSENTSHLKTLSATKSALFAPPLERCVRSATEYPRNCVTRKPGSPTGPGLARWGGRYMSRPEFAVSYTKQSHLKFLPGTPPTVVAPRIAISPSRRDPPVFLATRHSSLATHAFFFLIDNMIIRIGPNSFPLSTNSISNRQYSGGCLSVTISSCGLSRIGNAQFPKWNRPSRGAP
jgi:hypothetical protein